MDDEPHGTVIKSMIDRFRHGQPLSRSDREHLKAEGAVSPAAFWWRADNGTPARPHNPVGVVRGSDPHNRYVARHGPRFLPRW